MTDDSPRFVCVKHGWSRKITPVNRAGWIALLVWVAATAPLAGLFMWAMSRLENPALIGGATVAYIIVMAVWAVAMIRWMMARSEIIDVRELIKRKDANPRPGSRR